MELCIKNISKSYGKNRALDRFSVTLTPGIYALLGPNGSGKSTLMNILTDNLKADEGTITYTDNFGMSENILKMGEHFREKLGFMPQYPGIYPNFSAERFIHNTDQVWHGSIHRWHIIIFASQNIDGSIVFWGHAGFFQYLIQQLVGLFCVVAIWLGHMKISCV